MSPDEQFPLQKCDADWRAELTPEAYQVLRKHGTERAGTSPLNHEARAGAFSLIHTASSTAARAGRASFSRCRGP